MRTRSKKKLTRLILAALLSHGGVMFSPLSVEAVEVDAKETVVYVYNDAKPDTNIPPTGDGDISGKNNTINGTVTQSVYGGFTTNGNATGNKVVINGSAKIGVPSENWGVFGGSASGAANGNYVTINGGTINNDIWGGMGATADGNTVTVTGGAVLTKGIHGAAAMTGDATNNTVNILTPINLAYLFGGLNENEGANSSGNTLNIAVVGVKVGNGGVAKFQNMNFFFPKDTQAKDIMLTVENDYGGDLDLRGVTFGAAAQAGFSLAKDETVTLIKYEAGGEFKTDDTLKVADKATVLAEAEKINKIVPKSIVADEDYEFAITKEDKQIVATVTNVSEKKDSPELDDRKKSAVETRAATVTLLNAGADILASQGFSQAANAVALEAAEKAQNNTTGAPPVSTFTPFAAFGGSSMRAESGSHVDTKGFGLNIGFAREISNSQGKLLFGPVVEYGGGRYDSYNNDIHGDGVSHYWGLGLMARQVNHDGFYYEGSLRGGRVTSDYTERSTGLNSTYDSSSNYWAAHLGFGKFFAAGKSNTVDAYLKYFYSHQSGDDVTITSVNPDDPVQASFDSVNSNRIRIGARLTHKVNEMNSFYGGLAYQYEFGGEARAHFNGEGAPSPSVKGSSGMLELGWQVKPGGPLTLDLGVTGWAGKQRGGSVQLGATWTF